MEEKNYYFALSYDLMVGEEKEELMERASELEPLTFYSGTGSMLPKFEAHVLKLDEGDIFDFVLSQEDAYGKYDDNGVIDLQKKMFEVEGKIEEGLLVEGNVVPLMDNEGNRVNAAVVKVEDDTVKMDLNHPLAGENLHFIGKVLVKKEATQEEMAAQQASSCGGSCDSGSCDSQGGCDSCTCN